MREFPVSSRDAATWRAKVHGARERLPAGVQPDKRRASFPGSDRPPPAVGLHADEADCEAVPRRPPTACDVVSALGACRAAPAPCSGARGGLRELRADFTWAAAPFRDLMVTRGQRSRVPFVNGHTAH